MDVTVTFNKDILSSCFLFASSFSNEGTLWIKNETCELVISDGIFIKVIIPFDNIENIETDKVYCFNIPVKNIYKQSLSNNKSKDVKIYFVSSNEVKVEYVSLNNIVVQNNTLRYNESLSSYKLSSYESSEDESSDSSIEDRKIGILKDNNIKSNVILFQRYKTHKLTNEFYRINMYEYKNVVSTFMIDFISLNTFIKNLINIKPNNILFKLQDNKVFLECKGIEPIETNISSELLMSFKEKNNFDRLILFSCFKRLNTLSKLAMGEGKNKIKIYENILFQIVFNRFDEPYGLIISNNTESLFQEFFIFIPFIYKEE